MSDVFFYSGSNFSVIYIIHVCNSTVIFELALLVNNVITVIIIVIIVFPVGFLFVVGFYFLKGFVMSTDLYGNKLKFFPPLPLNFTKVNVVF